MFQAYATLCSVAYAHRTSTPIPANFVMKAKKPGNDWLYGTSNAGSYRTDYKPYVCTRRKPRRLMVGGYRL